MTKLDLLKDDEVDRLWNYQFKLRDGLCGILTNKICLLANADNVGFDYGYIMPTLGKLRGTMASHHDLFVQDNANLYLSLMFTVVNILLFMIIFCYPFTLIVYTPSASLQQGLGFPGTIYSF